MAILRLSRLAVLIPIVFLISGSLNSSLQADPAKVIWDATRNTSPETVEELKALQEQIKQITTATTRSTVGLLVGMGAGSGVIVSEDGLVLTAAHVIGKPGQRVMVILSDGTRVKAKSLGSNAKVDSGMVRIIDPPPRVLDAARWWAEFSPGSGNLQSWHPVPLIVEPTASARLLLAESRLAAEG